MNPRLRPIKVRSIIFTESCPLDCRYCNFKQSTNFGTSTNLTKDELFHFIQTIDKEDNVELIDSRILFSGGEPLLKWPWIKEIIEKYGHRFSYSFNTSGYLLTEEMLEFLSHYEVDFTLSIDGNEALTNYLRPVINSPYKVGYMKQFKKIVPTLLYYFPTIPFRIIINSRYVDLLYEMYQFANELGFKYFTFILDFNNRDYSRPNENINSTQRPWEDKHTEILQQQLDLIVQDILISYKNNIKRTQVLEFNKILAFLLNKKYFTPENMQCQLFNNRTLTTLYNETLDSYCLKKEFPDLDLLKEEVLKEYDSLNHKCILNQDCDLFEYCCTVCCIQNGYYKSQQFFDFDSLECVVNYTCYNAVLKLLSVGNELCKDDFLYQQYISDMIQEGG